MQFVCLFVSFACAGVCFVIAIMNQPSQLTIQTAAKNRKKYHDINNPILYLMELLVRCSSVRLSYPRNRLPHRKSKAY